jgi:hypothetical protein
MLILATPQPDYVRDAVDQALHGACEELAFSLQSLDVWKREQIGEVIWSLATVGERDVVQRRAVTYFRNLGDPIANA